VSIARLKTLGCCYSTVWEANQLRITFEVATVNKIVRFGLTVAAAFIFAACGGNAFASHANGADDTPEKGGSSGPTKAALVALEKSAYEAWKSRDEKFWGTFLADDFIGWGSRGRLDKSSATKEYTGADCKIESYILSDEQVSLLAKDAALLTYKATVDGTCGGQKIPANSRVAGVYVREGTKWKLAFHAQAAIVSPSEVVAKPVDGQQASESNIQPANRVARTDEMLEAERNVWEAWRTHDATKLAELTANDISFINIFGVYLPTKTDALHDWSGTYCEVKSISITDAVSATLSPAVGILTFKASADGTCYGQKIGPVWGTSVYVRNADTWKWTFGINLPERREGT
jgi:ketosteroid isomerase-like protein